jgi:signal transduction histidine kinase
MSETQEEKLAFVQELRHEINTPLAVIRGYAELIEEKLGTEVDPEVKRYLQVIMRNIDRLESATESILVKEED